MTSTLNSKMSEKIKIREVEAKLALPSMKEFDEYSPLHEQSGADMIRSMEGLKESMEAEQLRVETCPDQHLFGVETVEKEKLRGDANIVHLRSLVDQQDEVYRGLMTKVRAAEEVDWRRNEKVQADSRIDPYEIAYPFQEDDSVRVRNACSVANQIVRRQAKHDIHKQRQLRIAVDDAMYYDSLREKHRKLDEKAARSQKARVEKQMERTFFAQQKRNEQQKMLKEIQRSQDHQFELLQLKHHPEAVSTTKLPALPHSASAPAVPVGEPVKLNRHMSEPIFRHISDSHKLYSNTLEKWRTFEADNERRTDAYWRKMLQGESRKPATKPEAKAQVFSNAAKTITTIRSFCKRAKSTPGSFLEAGEDTGPYDEDMLEAVDMTHMSELSFDMASIDSPKSPGFKGNKFQEQYVHRSKSVALFHQDLERQRMEKAEKDRLKLEEKQRLGRAHQQRKAAKAGEYVDGWEKKSVASATQRQSLAVQDHSESIEKMSVAKQRLEDLENRKHQERVAMGDAKSQTQTSNKASADKNLEDSISGFVGKQGAKDERGAELLDGRLKQAHKRASSGHAEVAEQKMISKHQSEAEFRRKAAEDIKAKQERQAEAMKRVEKRVGEPAQRDQNKAMESLRLARKDKGRDDPSRAPPAELTLPPELELSPRLRLSPKGAGSRRSVSAGSSDQLSPSMSAAMDMVKRSGSPSGVDEYEQELTRVISRRSIDLSQSMRKPMHTPTSLLSTTGETNFGATASSGTRRRNTDSDDEDDDEVSGEDDFVNDLSRQSSKWLEQMRKARQDV